MKVGIYCRFSVESTDKNQYESSLEYQKTKGIEYCEKNGYDYKIYEDIEGRDVSFYKRRSGKFLMNDIEDGIIGGVWVLREDRIGELTSAVEFKTTLIKYNVKYFIEGREVDFSNDGDYLTTHLLSIISTIDRRGIKRRVYRGLKDRVKRGLFIGVHPYGFIANKKELIYDEEKMEIIRKVYKSWVDKEWENVRDWILYCQNVIGLKKTPLFFYNLFRRTHYNGRKTYKFKGETIEIEIPKVIDDDLYNRCVEKANKIIQFGRGNNRHKHFTNILKGLVYCKVCGNKCNIHHSNRIVKKMGNKRKRTLRCRFGWDIKGNTINNPNKKFKQPQIHTTTFYYRELADSIYKMLVNLLFNSNIIKNEFKRLYKDRSVDVKEYQKEIRQIDKQLKALKTKEITLEDRLLDGLISEENILKHKENLNIQKIMLEGRKESYVDDINKIESSNEILGWIDKFKNEYSIKSMMKKDDKEKRDLIRKYIKRIDVIGSTHKGYEIDIKLNVPIYNDTIKIDKRKYWEYINNGGDKKKWKKEWVIEEGETTISNEDRRLIEDDMLKKKMLLNNQNIN